MSGLHSDAKQLIEAAKRGEASPSPETLARVHRSVLQRVAVLAGAATATGSAVATAKAAVGVSLATKLIVATAAGGALMLGLISVPSSWIAPAKPSPSHARSAQQVSATPRLASSAPRPVASSVLNPATISSTVSRDAAAPSTALAAPATISDSAKARATAPRSELPPPARAASGITAAGEIALPTELPPPATARAQSIDDPQERLTRPRRSRTYTQAPVVTLRGNGAPPEGEEIDRPSGPSQGAPAAVNVQPARSQASMAPRSVQESARAEVTRGEAEKARAASPRLTAELGLLRSVHAALQSGRPAEALALLKDAEAIVQHGYLEQEARGAAISALCQLGRERAARAALERFRSRWPRTPLASRLQGGCRLLGGAD